MPEQPHQRAKRAQMSHDNGVPPEPPIVRPILAADSAAWHEMWPAYCAFYNATVPAAVSAQTWRRIIDDADDAMHALVAVDGVDGAVVGFANYIIHPFTWSDRSACYLEDLFVRPEARGRGIGRALITSLVALGERCGWAQVYWMTQESNAVARRVYDRFGPCDDFVRYRLTLDDPRKASAPPSPLRDFAPPGP